MIMPIPSLGNCTAALIAYKYLPLYLVKIGQLLLSLATLVFMLPVFYAHLKNISRSGDGIGVTTRKLIRFHPNLKVAIEICILIVFEFYNPPSFFQVIMICGSIFYAVHSVFIVFQNAVKIVSSPNQ